jgi:hypothetical protein
VTGLRNPARRGLAALLLTAMPAVSALAYWELTPQAEVGMTFENNPRYISDEEEPFVLPLNPDAADNVLGVYVDARLKGAYKTPSTEVSLVPRIRQTNYLKSNTDLNDDDWYVDFAAAHNGILGGVGLTASYQDTGVRTSEFETAIPDDPDGPVPITDGSGRFSDDTRESWDVQPSLSYQLSPRNVLGVTGLISETTYDEQREELLASRSYLDYSYSSLELSLRHVLDANNYFALALNGGNFLADETGRQFENSTDSFGITAAYNRAFSDTLTGTLTLGITRSSLDVAGIVGGFDPLTGAPCLPSDPCSTSNEERNFVGSLDVRKRSELTTLNFSISSQIAPRSDGTEVVQEQARVYVVRTLTSRLTGTLGAIYSQESAVGQIFQPETSTLGFARQDRNYFTVEPGVAWQLTETLSVFASYAYQWNDTDVGTGSVEETNNRVFLGVRYQGVPLRR